MTDDYAFYRDKMIDLIRQDGANQARLDGHDEAIDRIEKAVTDGFTRQEQKTAEQINHIRGEIKATADSLVQAIEDVKQERADFRKALSRVGWAIIAAVVVVAAAAAQTALSPQIAGVAMQALGGMQ